MLLVVADVILTSSYLSSSGDLKYESLKLLGKFETCCIDVSTTIGRCLPPFRSSHCFTFSSWALGVPVRTMSNSRVVPLTKKLNGLHSLLSFIPRLEKLHVPLTVSNMSLEMGSPLIIIKRVYNPLSSRLGAAIINFNSSRSI
ncbi:hypothetical protein MDV094.5 [Gallid alphaherpesvirus 2]|uniref:Uncharacterized protein n=1 Tax=Gallid alphaherpesvirus 2 TaxID=10390 RepID=Q19B22_9ALPH|nr:hypothetical protein MDV094.5 [Gallid alphaherpesvirus 2]